MRAVTTLCLCGASLAYYLPAQPPVPVQRHAPVHAILSGKPPRRVGSNGAGQDPLDWQMSSPEAPTRRVSVGAPPQPEEADGSSAVDKDGFVFGLDSLERATAALRDGSLVLLAEDGAESTRALLVANARDVTAEQLQFVLSHCTRLQAALEPAAYAATYRSLHQIVLDNNNLAQPALSVAARGAGRSPRNATHIAAAIHALMQTECWSADDAAAVGAEGGAASATDYVGRDAAREIATSSSPLVCPGTLSLGQAREGGILRRAGATEASVELAKFADLPPIGLHASLPATSLANLKAFAAKYDLPLTSTADLVAYARKKGRLVERCGPPARMPTKFGRFIAHTYRSRIDGTEHIALVRTGSEGDSEEGGAAGGGGADPKSQLQHDSDVWGEEGVVGKATWGDADELQPFRTQPNRPALVRVHSECNTGDVFGSLRCDCGPQLEKALEEIVRDGYGVLLYLRGQEGRGIGLGAKMHAYALQERGLDTQDANLALGLPVDSREYGTGAQILADLGIRDMRLMSNNPQKFSGLAGFGLTIVERVPSHTAPNPENIKYLRTKLERMGHFLGEVVDEGDKAKLTERGDAGASAASEA